MTNLILKRVLPSVIGLVLLVLGALWLYGYVGVKAGWIGPTEVPAGGIAGATKAKLGL